MPTQIITDGSMDRLVEAPPVVLAKHPQAFQDRAARFDALAGNADMGRYMRLLGGVCRGQASAMGRRKPSPIDEKALTNSREYGMPPLSAHVFPREPVWREDLLDVLSSILATPDILTSEIKEKIAELQAAITEDPIRLEAMADRLIAGEPLPEDGPMVPFVGASLQVYFSRLASSIDVADVGACDVATVCPCCGMRPTGSVIRLDPDRVNYRYLVCSLCLTEWNMSRVRCSSCESEKSVGYLIIDEDVRSAQDAAVRAETCDDCKTYLKIFIQEKSPTIDVIADDLATLALDILVDEKGYSRTGPNLLFYPGQA